MNIEEQIIDILNKHKLTISELGQTTSLRTAAKEITSLLKQQERETVMGFVGWNKKKQVLKTPRLPKEAEETYNLIYGLAETYLKEGKQ